MSSRFVAKLSLYPKLTPDFADLISEKHLSYRQQHQLLSGDEHLCFNLKAYFVFISFLIAAISRVVPVYSQRKLFSNQFPWPGSSFRQ